MQLRSQIRASSKPHQSTADDDGFTLVEILVTLPVLSIALPVLMYSFRNAAHGQAQSENRTTAVYLLKFRMAEIELIGYPDIGEEDGEFGENSRFRTGKGEFDFHEHLCGRSGKAGARTERKLTGLGARE